MVYMGGIETGEERAQYPKERRDGISHKQAARKVGKKSKMRRLLLVLVLGAVLLEAEALKCRQSSCTGTRPCSSTTVTCSRDATLCFVMMKSQPLITMIRGCISPSNCQIMKAFEPSTVCCSRDLCN